MPANLIAIASLIDKFNHKLGQKLLWLGLLLVLLQFALVVAGHVFHIGSIGLQELLFYINSLLFLAGGGYTLLHDEHVRVDVVYRDSSEKSKNLVNFVGTILLLTPVMILIWVSATPFVVSSWVIFEGSIETSGLPAVFILKTFILLYALTLSAQGISIIIKTLDGLKKGNNND